jgi:hypothetical protein
VSAAGWKESDQAEKALPEMPRDLYVFDDDRPRHEGEMFVATYEASDPTLVTPVDAMTTENAEEPAPAANQERTTLVAAMATGAIGAGWFVARRARKAESTAAPHTHTFSKGASLMRLIRRRSLERCSN